MESDLWLGRNLCVVPATAENQDGGRAREPALLSPRFEEGGNGKPRVREQPSTPEMILQRRWTPQLPSGGEGVEVQVRRDSVAAWTSCGETARPGRTCGPWLVPQPAAPLVRSCEQYVPPTGPRVGTTRKRHTEPEDRTLPPTHIPWVGTSWRTSTPTGSEGGARSPATRRLAPTRSTKNASTYSVLVIFPPPVRG
ncbi:hypothetical protein NDU88_007448 [Pleurodeles waltl]|uniref:Uncharacterized protein n=1 Tax=Pleurodeles waltl TaxID=8319 RepID=A0AAV7N232_PLEWA|nr:hypothetical protein NDU88_007448 [Pleurodeles waltl]